MTTGAPWETVTERSRRAALLLLCVGELMILLDATVVNVALPSIQQELGFSQGGLAWVVNAYLIAFGGLLLLAGRLGDLAGQRRVFLAGLIVFTAASVLCAIAPDRRTLVAARFGQGIGGALTSAVVLAMIVGLFPKPREQARAIGVYGFVSAGGSSIGLVLGGALTAGMNWHWIFLINLPIGVLTVLLSLRYVPSPPGIGLARGADVLGAALLTGGLMLGVRTVLELDPHDWAAARTLGPGIVSVALVAGFLLRQRLIPQPLMPLRLFGSRSVSAANGIHLLMVAGIFGVFFFGALYLQQLLGFGPLQVGLAFVPAAVTMALTALAASGSCLLRWGTRTTLLVSLAAIAASLLLLARTPVEGSYPVDVLPALLLFGLGGGLAFPSLMGLGMSDVADHDSGLASGLLSTTYQLGGALGLAVVSTVAAYRAGEAPTSGQRVAGFHAGYLVAAVLVFAALVVTAVIVPSRNAPRRQEPGSAVAGPDELSTS